MRRVAVISSTLGWHAADLVRALGERCVEAVVIDPRSLHAVVATGESRVDGRTASASCELDRLDTAIVRTIPAGSLEQIVFRMDALHELERRGVRVINSPAAIEISIDKYRALASLSAAGLPVPRTVVCEGATGIPGAFDALGGDVVVKPLFGSEGRGIERLRNRGDLEDFVAQRLDASGSVAYLQEFIAHPGHDFRVFVIDGDVVASMRRSSGNSWLTNVAQGGTPSRWTPDDRARDLATRAAAAAGCRVAGVDLVPDGDGRLFVLEINAAPGWRALSAVTGVDVAGRIADDALES